MTTILIVEDEHLLREGLEGPGANDSLYKPFKNADLLAKVKGLVGQ